jgi:predicted Zn-dependent peptidase
MKEILAMVADLAKNGATGAELEKSRLNLVRDLPDRFEDNGDVARTFAGLVTLGLPLDWYDGYSQKIAHVQASDVREAARRFLEGKLVFVVVGDLATVEKEIGALGLGKPLRYGLDGKRR